MIELIKDDLGTGVRYNFGDIKAEDRGIPAKLPRHLLRSLEFRNVMGYSLGIEMLPHNYYGYNPEPQVRSFLTMPLLQPFSMNSRSIVVLQKFLSMLDQEFDLLKLEHFFNKGKNTGLFIEPHPDSKTPGSWIHSYSHTGWVTESSPDSGLSYGLLNCCSSVALAFQDELEAYIWRREHDIHRSSSEGEYPFFRKGWEVKNKTCPERIVPQVYSRILQLEREVESGVAEWGRLEGEIRNLEASFKPADGANVFASKDVAKQSETNGDTLRSKRAEKENLEKTLDRKASRQWGVQCELDTIFENIIRKKGIHLVRSFYKGRRECKDLNGYKDLSEQYQEIVSFWREVTRDVALDPELMMKQYDDYLSQLRVSKENGAPQMR